ncbi:MAG: flavodoxin family protein [Ruminococcus sp.]|nr:flavodoxin family protein [Ruminococcus sp.]
MKNNILILNGSMRKNGNTARLVQSFADGAVQNNNVEIVYVADYNVNPCIGCNSCFVREGNKCFQDDDMVKIYEKLRNADIVVIASPVYFYGISAQLKAIVDRLHTPMRNTFHIKKLGLLLVGAAQLPNLFDPILMQYQMVLEFFKLESIGTVLVRGVNDIGDIDGNSALKEAYDMGVSIE